MYRHRQSPYDCHAAWCEDGLVESVSSTRPSMEVEKMLSTIHGFILAGHDIEPGDRKQRKVKTRKYMPIQIKGFERRSPNLKCGRAGPSPGLCSRQMLIFNDWVAAVQFFEANSPYLSFPGQNRPRPSGKNMWTLETLLDFELIWLSNVHSGIPDGDVEGMKGQRTVVDACHCSFPLACLGQTTWCY